jgi:hypothetical protein
MYIRVYERLGQPPEVMKDFEEQKRRFEMAKAEHQKRLALLRKRQFMPQCPVGTESAQTYKLPFTSAESAITEKDAPQIFTILCGPSPWQQYLRSNLNAHLQDLPMRPIRIVTDDELAQRFKGIYNQSIPASVRGFVDRRNAIIYLSEFPNRNSGKSLVGLALHEAVHLFSYPPGRSNQLSSKANRYLGAGLLEGLTQSITEDIQTKQSIDPMPDEWQAYKEYVPVARQFIKSFTPGIVGDAYFKGNIEKLHAVIKQQWTYKSFYTVKMLTNQKKKDQALKLIDSLQKAYLNKPKPKIQQFQWIFR